MRKAVTIHLIDGRVIPGFMTDEHAASSYGSPVFVDEHDQAIDSWLVSEVVMVKKDEAKEQS